MMEEYERWLAQYAAETDQPGLPAEGWREADMCQAFSAGWYTYKPLTPPKRRRRLRLYSSGEFFRRWSLATVAAAAAWGVILGDCYLWRVLHG